jgi:DNA-binding CsgD family transcriptional regulator
MSDGANGGCAAIVAIASDQDGRLNELIRSIVAITEIGAEPANTTIDTGERVVFDVDCDGDRYVLIRMPRLERKTLPLSPREQEIVRMVAQGYQNKVIAGVLNISSWTVCTHLRRIFAKLGVSSRAAMVARLAEYGGVREVRVTDDAVRSAAAPAIPREPLPRRTGAPTLSRPSWSKPVLSELPSRQLR